MRQRVKKIKLNKLLLRVAAIADKAGVEAFLVGGAVRDALAGKKNYDLDIMSEKNPEALVRPVAKLIKGRVKSYPRFGTFCVETPKGLRIDFATARKEVYERPGALPKVSFSDIESDAARRDFTVNALALRLNGMRRGAVIDYYSGQRDLKNGVLRILHSGSFRDDPTRIFRLARFASRGFRIDRLTGKAARAGARFLRRVSVERRSAELMLMMGEKNPYGALQTFKELGAADIALPGLDISERLAGLEKKKTPDQRFAALFAEKDKAARLALYRELRFPRKLQNGIERCLAPKAGKAALNGYDLIKMGYRQGPVFKKILLSLAAKRIRSRRAAKKYVFDNFPQKI